MRTKKPHGKTALPLPPAKRANKKSSSHAPSSSHKTEKEKSAILKEKEKLAILKERDLCNTKFAHKESMKDLGVLEDADTGDTAEDQDEYMARFTTVNTGLTSLRAEVVHLRGELTDQRAMLRLMYAHQREMGRTIVSLRDRIG